VVGEKNWWEKKIVSLADKYYNQVVIDMITRGKKPFVPFQKDFWLKNTSDFFGVNYYDPVTIKFFCGIPIKMDFKLPDQQKTTQMGWGIYPKGLYEILMRIKQEFKGPIYVTENGIATLNDSERQEFIVQHLVEVHKAIQNGADVRGYFYWSSLDNWEWAEGFEPRFGLIGLDYSTRERIIRESARMYQMISQNNKLSKELVEKYTKN